MSQAEMTLEKNRQQFESFINLLQAQANDHGDDEQTLRMAHALGNFAWRGHTGYYANKRIEELVHQVGRRLGVSHRSESPGGFGEPGDPARILHVFSEAMAAAGGHIRMPRRWMDLDNTRQHSIAVIHQPRDLAICPQLIAAARRTGGSVEDISAQWPTLVDRARRLREVARDYDLVVLHVHPYDVTAAAALTGRSHGPVVVWENHADHVFWLGVGSADLYAHFRNAGLELSAQRRGIPQARSVVLPLPVDEFVATTTQIEAKTILGLDPESVLLFSAATAYKYQPMEGIGFLDLVTPVLKANTNAVLLVAGGAGGPQWQQANQECDGRLVTIGHQSDMSVIRQATDIYLDSYFLPSCTSYLEAAVASTPTVNFAPFGDVGPLEVADFVDNETIVTAATVSEYHAKLTELINCAEVRKEAGKRARKAAETHNLGTGWQQHLQSLYQAAGSVDVSDLAAIEDSEARFDRMDYFNLALHTQSQQAPSLEACLLSAGVDLDLFDRYTATGTAVKLSVVVVTSGDPEQTISSMQSVVETCVEQAPLELVVVDNASTDETGPVLASIGSDISLVRFDKAVATSTAWAAGIQRCSGTFVVFLSSDVTLAPGWLGPIMKAFEDRPSLSTATPSIRTAGALVASQPPAVGTGVCLVARRAALEAGTANEAHHVRGSIVTLGQYAKAGRP